MPNSKSTEPLAWTLFAVAVFATIVYAGLYYSHPKIIVTKEVLTVTNTVNNTVTNFLTNEVVKEVEKTVKVPAAIPDDLLQAQVSWSIVTNAPWVKSDQILFGMKDIKVNYYLTDAVQQIISEAEIKAKFELTLRRNNIPINPNSKNIVSLEIEGFWDNNFNNILCEATTCSVAEPQFVVRNGTWKMSAVTVWRQCRYGTVGKTKANDGILQGVEKEAELFANDFLSANPK